MSNQENISKETKKTRRKKSHRKAQQIKLAVIMIMVSVLVLSASTFAWYQLNNTAKVEDMKFTADTLGNLLIAEAVDSGDVNDLDKLEPGTWESTLDLGLSDSDTYLLPSTTTDGKAFRSPVYDGTGKTVQGVSSEALAGADLSKYVYTKVFYIKSGTSVDENKYYTLKLADGTKDANGFNGGTYIKDEAQGAYTATNAIRVSFVLGEGAYLDANQAAIDENANTKIWEPYDATDTNAVVNGTRATNLLGAEYGAYSSITITQDQDGKLTNNELCKIMEGKEAKITMYVWIEGTDDDCINEIALDTVVGQLQFIAE